jgi:uncharacterized protein YkwD
MKKRTQSGRVTCRVLAAVGLAVGLLAIPASSSPPSNGVLGTAAAAGKSGCRHTGARPARVTRRHLRISTRCLINRARNRHGLRPLRINVKLRRAATRHSRAMVRHRFFAHGSTRVRIAGTGYFARARSWAYGEVIGFGCHRDGSAKLVFRRWMRSSGHRAAILTGRFRELGVGVARRDPAGGGRKCATYTVDFGVSR